jgi:hypothetical protein
MQVETARFLAGGESLAGCKRFHEEMRVALDAWGAFVQEVGGDPAKIAYHPYTGELSGVTFPKGTMPDPTLWREDKKKRVWMPRRNTPAGKALAARVEALPKQPTQWRAHEYVGIPGDAHFGVTDFSRGLSSSRCSIESFGDQYVVSVRFALGVEKSRIEINPAVPPGSKEILASEYAALLEGTPA